MEVVITIGSCAGRRAWNRKQCTTGAMGAQGACAPRPRRVGQSVAALSISPRIVTRALLRPRKDAADRLRRPASATMTYLDRRSLRTDVPACARQPSPDVFPHIGR